MTTNDVGRFGEDRAAAWYEANGYQILDRNWRVRSGELDIVAGQGGDVVFCEVKTRRSATFGSGAEAVDQRKQRRVRALARAWLHETERRYQTVRFDVASVDGAGRVEIIEGCF